MELYIIVGILAVISAFLGLFYNWKAKECEALKNDLLIAQEASNKQATMIDALDKQVNTLKRDNSISESRLKDVSQSLQSERNSHRDTTQQVQDLDQDLERVKAERDELQSEIDRLKSQPIPDVPVAEKVEKVVRTRNRSKKQ